MSITAIYTKLLSVDKVDFLVGPYGTALIAPAMPIVMQKKLAFISLYGLAVNLAIPLQHRYGALPVLLRAQLVALIVVVFLVFQWQVLEIRQWLVDVGDVVRKNLGDRLDFDTKPAERRRALARARTCNMRLLSTGHQGVAKNT